MKKRQEFFCVSIVAQPNKSKWGVLPYLPSRDGWFKPGSIAVPL